ncbi:hypothetical protein FRC17_003903 [Serendipita sp. 399]|nr:hypothetical protein FRC17_003903 [Serendipita sp. 399]
MLEKRDGTPTITSHIKVRAAMTANPSMLPSPSTKVLSRRSKRLRGENGFIRLICLSSDRKCTVLGLLYQISFQEGVPVNSQTLYYEGKQIEDESVTLEELNFTSGDLFQLVIDKGRKSDASIIDLDSGDDILVESASKRRKVPPAEGRAFQGTVLSGA